MVEPDGPDKENEVIETSTDREDGVSDGVNEDTGTEDDHEEEEEEEGEDEDGSSEEESDEEEIEEPKLKYSRLTDLPPAIFTSDALSTCLITENFFVFATHAGVLHITDTNLKLIRSLRAHNASILGLSSDGHYVGSASMDGTVVIGSVADPKDVTMANFHRPVQSVALDPNYKSTKAFISGGMSGQVVYSEKSWLGRRTDTILDEGEDPVISVHWIESILLWMNDSGITVYSRSSMSILMTIPKPKNTPRADLYKPRVSVPESNRIYIAWADTIWTLKITIEKPKMSSFIPSSASVKSLAAEPKVEIEASRTVEWLIGGIAPFGHDTLMMLGYLPPPQASEDTPRPQAPAPELKLYDMEAGEESYADVLSLVGYERLGVNDYHLGCHIPVRGGSPKYYILSARDAVMAQKRDMNDRLQWLLEHKLYEQAWSMSENLLDAVERKNIGIKWVESLVSKDKWSEAAMAFPMVLKNLDNEQLKEEWETWGWIFIKANQLSCLAEILPVLPDLDLDKSIYDSVLIFFSEQNRERLLDYLNKWPVELYDSAMVKRQLEDELHEEPQDTKLRRALVTLYISTDDPGAAVTHLLYLQDASVIDLISKYHLLPSLINQLPEILTVMLGPNELTSAPVEIIRTKTEPAIRLVVEGRHEVIPDTVIDQLQKNSSMDVLSFLYLERLNEVDSFLSQGFGDLQVKLYAEFDRPKLLKFIQKNSNYNLEMAVNICEKNDYTTELVYLLGMVGQNKRALKLIIEKLQDPVEAINFAKAQRDRELWADLINYSMDKPIFIRMLLEKGTSSVDAVDIIKRIPDAMEIPEFKKVLIEIFSQKESSLSISQGVFDIIQTEARTYSEDLRGKRHRGTLLNLDDQKHLDASRPIIVTPDNDLKNEKDLTHVDDKHNWRSRDAPAWSVVQKINHLAYILRNLA
jgi:hypothetical protein